MWPEITGSQQFNGVMSTRKQISYLFTEEKGRQTVRSALEQLKKVFLRREYGGFFLALIALFVINIFAEPYGTLLSFVVIYGGMALIRNLLK